MSNRNNAFQIDLLIQHFRSWKDTRLLIFNYNINKWKHSVRYISIWKSVFNTQKYTLVFITTYFQHLCFSTRGDNTQCSKYESKLVSNTFELTLTPSEEISQVLSRQIRKSIMRLRYTSADFQRKRYETQSGCCILYSSPSKRNR